MKVLQMSSYFEPEQIASTHLTRDLYEAFSEHEIYVEDYVPTPCRGISRDVRDKYKTIRKELKYNGYYEVNRFPMFAEGRNPAIRAFRYILVNIVQYLKGIHAKNIDLIFAASTPPTQGLLCSLVKKRLKVPFVYNLQDIFPDSLVNAGLTNGGSLLWRIGRKIEDYTYGNADKIIVISDSFKENIMRKGVPEEKIQVIPNWIDVESIIPVERNQNRLIDEFGLDPKKFNVLYAGNFGATQGAGIVLDVAEKMQNYSDIQFVIFGGGAYFMDVAERAKNLSNSFVHELLPQDRVSEVYSLGDVALITCKKGTGRAGFPSKTWSIMACNTPIIASFDMDSDLAATIHEANAGICVEPEDIDSLYQAIVQAYELWKIRENKVDLRRYVIENASKEKCVQAYLDCMEEASERTHAFVTD